MRFDKEFCQPEFESWPDHLKTNHERLKPLADLRRNFKKALSEEAGNFTSAIEQKSFELLGEGIYTPVSIESENIIMTGHQPEIYHHGLLYKNYLLNQAVKKGYGRGVNLIIDTDEGHAASITFPVFSSGQPSKKKKQLGAEIKPYLFHSLPDREVLREFFSEIEGSSYPGLYEKLSGLPVTEAHTIARRIYEKSPSYLEVPLSVILRNEACSAFMIAIIKDSRRFATIYNETLDRYRSEHKIKNLANPFPNLKFSDNSLELPFWIVNHGSEKRDQLLVSKDGKILHPEGTIDIEALLREFLLIPKAAITTLIARTALSDLFIHGLGGASYDRFTDKLIKNYYGIDAPVYASASADLYYFRDEIKSYEDEKHQAERRRKLHFHPEKHLELFQAYPSLMEKIMRLSRRKKELVEEIKSKKSRRESTAEETAQIKEIEASVKSAVEAAFGPAPEYREPSKQYIETIYSRDFSFFVV